METPNESPPEFVDLPTEEPLEGIPTGLGVIGRGEPSSKYPQGREAFDRKGFALYNSKPLEGKKKQLLEQWARVAYIVLGKAESFAITVTKKDFGRLMQVLTAAGIAHDKLFPKGDTLGINNLVVNMFKGLPSDKLMDVVGSQPIPKGIPLDVSPLEITTNSSTVENTP